MATRVVTVSAINKAGKEVPILTSQDQWLVTEIYVLLGDAILGDDPYFVPKSARPKQKARSATRGGNGSQTDPLKK
jgi:hypothetical protein